jgi:hypothetical protein
MFFFVSAYNIASGVMRNLSIALVETAIEWRTGNLLSKDLRFPKSFVQSSIARPDGVEAMQMKIVADRRRDRSRPKL